MDNHLECPVIQPWNWHDSVTMSQYSQYQDPETAAAFII